MARGNVRFLAHLVLGLLALTAALIIALLQIRTNPPAPSTPAGSTLTTSQAEKKAGQPEDEIASREAASGWTVLGRLVQARSGPLEGAAVRIEAEDEITDSGWWLEQTAADGRFELSGIDGERGYRLSVETGERALATWSVHLNLPEPRDASRVDLGDIILEPSQGQTSMAA